MEQQQNSNQLQQQNNILQTPNLQLKPENTKTTGPKLILEKPRPGYFTRLFTGRMNRQNFIVGSSFFGLLPLISIGVILCNSFFTSLSATSNLSVLPSLSDNNAQLLNAINPQFSLSSFTSTPFDKEWIAIGIVLLIISVPYLLSVQIKRLHDLNLTGWLWIINIIPFFQNPFTLDITSTFGMIMVFLTLVSTIFSFYTTFWPGTNGPNKYGDPPLPRSSFLRDVLEIR
jgi:uncharacterized membrane protein YhaH (DUF805 family)